MMHYLILLKPAFATLVIGDVTTSVHSKEGDSISTTIISDPTNFATSLFSESFSEYSVTPLLSVIPPSFSKNETADDQHSCLLEFDCYGHLILKQEDLCECSDKFFSSS